MATPRSTSRFLEPWRSALVGAAAASVAFACYLGGGTNDSGDAGSSCPKGLPTCSAAPSYANDIAPLVAARCVACHSPGGVAADRDLTTWAGISNLESTVLAQVYSCMMPPADAGPGDALTPAEREELLQWLVCGAPDN